MLLDAGWEEINILWILLLPESDYYCYIFVVVICAYISKFLSLVCFQYIFGEFWFSGEFRFYDAKCNLR